MSEKKYIHTNDALSPSLIVLTQYEDRVYIEIYHRHTSYMVDKSKLEAAIKEMSKQDRV